MSWITGVAVYVVTWWIVLFAVLPFGVQREESPQPGVDPGAPARPHMKLKLLATTLVSFLVWLGFYLAVREGLIDFRAEYY
jgi:predicted secreted protein